MDKTENKIIRARGFNVQRSYIFDITVKLPDGTKYVPDDHISESTWRQQIKDTWTDYAKQNVESGAFIFHDSDFENGVPKPLHVHGLFKFKNARTQSSVMKSLGITRSGNCAPVESYVGSYRYMLHITDAALNDKKAIYPINQVYTFNIDMVDAMAKTTDTKESKLDRAKVDNFIAALHLRIMREGMTATEAQSAILDEFNDNPIAVAGFVKARSSFEKDMLSYDNMRATKYLADGRDLKNIYIQGPGGLGKTKLARAMALLKSDGRLFHASVQDTESKTFDFVDMYEGQLTSVFDEIKADSFQAREFLGIFDEHNYTPVASRVKDKHWLAQYSFFTNSDSLFKWRYDLIRYSKGGSNDVHPKTGRINPHADTETLFWQVTRRFHSMVVLEQLDNGDLLANVYLLNKPKRGFTYVGNVTAVSNFYENRSSDDVIIDGISYNATEAFARSVMGIIDQGLPKSNGGVIYDKVLFQKSSDVDTSSVGALPYVPTPSVTNSHVSMSSFPPVQYSADDLKKF